MNRSRGGHVISGAFVFLLLGVFAAFGTLLVLLGSQAFRSMDVRTNEHNQTRLLQSFVRHAVRAEDAAGCVAVRDLNGHRVLCIADEDAEDTYMTCIYVFEDKLCELYTSWEDGFDAEQGEAICPAKAFDARIDGQRLSVQLTDLQGRESSLCIVLYSGEVTP